MRSFPGPGGKWQISNAGGADPHWSADGKELYYRAPDQKLMAVEVRDGDALEAGIPQALFHRAVHDRSGAQQVPRRRRTDSGSSSSRRSGATR